ncbi:Tn3 family transposase [Streptomyces populi]
MEGGPGQNRRPSRFAPRFRDLADQRFWRADPLDGEEPADGHGPLEGVACSKVDLKEIATHWPDMLSAAGSSSPTGSGLTTCCGCSAVKGARLRCGQRSPSTGGSTRPCTCSRRPTRSMTPADA